MDGQLVPVSFALSEDERKDPDKLMQKVIEALELTIKMHPEQWVMFSPIWTEN